MLLGRLSIVNTDLMLIIILMSNKKYDTFCFYIRLTVMRFVSDKYKL